MQPTHATPVQALEACKMSDGDARGIARSFAPLVPIRQADRAIPEPNDAEEVTTACAR